MPHPDDHQPPRPAQELPSYALEEHEEPVGWRRWLNGRRLVIVLFAIAVVAGAVFGAKPIYRELKARRALAIAEQAGEALDRGDGAKASALLRQAALMAFQDERVAARITYHAARAGDLASVAEIGKQIDAGQASPEEIIVFGERSLDAGKTAEAGRALDTLPSSLPPDLAARRAAVLAGCLHAQGQTENAKSTLRQAIGNLPAADTDSLRVMLARVLLGEEGAPSRDEARQLLEQAAAGSGKDAAAALRLLAASSAGIAPAAQKDLDETAERLRKHPAASPADELFIARLVVSSDPSRKDEAVKTMVARMKERGASTDDRVVAARWLIGLQEHEAVLDLIDPADPSKHAGALMVRLDALSGLNRWDDCSRLIEDNHGGTLPDTFYYLFRARIAESRGEKDKAAAEKKLLRQTMQFAELPHVLFAARYAESVGWKPEAFAAWRFLSADNGARVEALRGQLRNIPDTVSASDAAEIAGELLALQPGDPSARLSAAYFRLMAQLQIADSAAVAEEMLAADPESVDIRRVAALARLRTGKAAAGLAIWPDDNEENRWRALHIALLRAAGQTDAADKIARAIDPRTLTPEEQALLKGN